MKDRRLEQQREVEAYLHPWEWEVADSALLDPSTYGSATKLAAGCQQRVVFFGLNAVDHRESWRHALGPLQTCAMATVFGVAVDRGALKQLLFVDDPVRFRTITGIRETPMVVALAGREVRCVFVNDVDASVWSGCQAALNTDRTRRPFVVRGRSTPLMRSLK